MPTNRHVDAWGAYRPAIEDHLAACADYLGRLERSLTGEIAPDRHYFSDKAHQLHQSARRLERLVQDTDRWLAGCHARVEHRYEDGTRSLGECELPAGHDGDHDGDLARLAGETLCVRARDLADDTERLSHRLGWIAPNLDRQQCGISAIAAKDREELRDAGALLERVAHQATRLAHHVRVELGHDQPDMSNACGLAARCVPPPADPPLSVDL
jgi:hypothetical protein